MSLFTGLVNAISGSSAAKAQEKAAQRAADISKAQYAETRADYAPAREFGGTALSRLSDAYGFAGDAGYDRTTENFRADPGYQYAVSEGTRAVEDSKAAKGGLFSGGTLKAIQDRGMNLADQGYSNYLSRIRDAVGVGQQAIGQGAQLGAGAAQNEGQLALQKGEARATGIIQPALTYNNMLNNVYKLAGDALGGGKSGAYG